MRARVLFLGFLTCLLFRIVVTGGVGTTIEVAWGNTEGYVGKVQAMETFEGKVKVDEQEEEVGGAS